MIFLVSLFVGIDSGLICRFLLVLTTFSGFVHSIFLSFLLAIDCKKHIIAVTPIFLPCMTSFTSSRSGTYLWFDVMLSKCMEVSFLVIFTCFFLLLLLLFFVVFLPLSLRCRSGAPPLFRPLPRLKKSNHGWPARELIPSLTNDSFLSRGIVMDVLGVHLFWHGEGDWGLPRAEGCIRCMGSVKEGGGWDLE